MIERKWFEAPSCKCGDNDWNHFKAVIHDLGGTAKNLKDENNENDK